MSIKSERILMRDESSFEPQIWCSCPRSMAFKESQRRMLTVSSVEDWTTHMQWGKSRIRTETLEL